MSERYNLYYNGKYYGIAERIYDNTFEVDLIDTTNDSNRVVELSDLSKFDMVSAEEDRRMLWIKPRILASVIRFDGYTEFANKLIKEVEDL